MNIVVISLGCRFISVRRLLITQVIPHRCYHDGCTYRYYSATGGGEYPVAFSPMGMNNQFIFYSCGNANATFTIDLSSMVISVNGQNYHYALSKTTGNSVNTPSNPGYTPNDGGNSFKME